MDGMGKDQLRIRDQQHPRGNINPNKIAKNQPVKHVSSPTVSALAFLVPEPDDPRAKVFLDLKKNINKKYIYP
jgi:hypothetical protein